jgi:hypothetical protein
LQGREDTLASPVPFSHRTSWPSHPNALTTALGERRARSLPTIDLTLSNPTRAGLDLDASRLLGPLADPRGLLYHPDPLGLPSAREAVARSLSRTGLPVDPGRIILTASSSEAYSHLFHVLADAGDEILAPSPSYPLFSFLADLAGVRLVPYPLRYDGSWYVDLDAVEAAITPRTRAILIVSPNNPTGSYLKKEEAEVLRALAARHGLALIVDEVFADYPLSVSERRCLPLVAETTALTFSLGGLSKAAGLPQLKLGWVVASGPPSLVDQAIERLATVADTFLSVGTPVQVALPALLEQAPLLAQAIRDRIGENLAALRTILAAPSPATVLDVEGGWYAVVRLPATRSEDEWTLALLDRGVLVHPGHFFDFDREAFVVLSLLPRPEEFSAGVREIKELVAEG